MLTPEQKQRQSAYFKEYYKRNREQMKDNNRSRSILYWETKKTYQLDYKKYRYLTQTQKDLKEKFNISKMVSIS